MNFGSYALVVGSAFIAGVINSVAGGGTVLTFPALIAAGLSPITANATSTVALVPGSFTAAYGFRNAIGSNKGLIIKLAIVNIVGGAIGTIVVLCIGDALFARLVPWLILCATFLFIAQEPISNAMKARIQASDGETASGEDTLTGPAAFKMLSLQFVFAIYGGFFGAGMGILMLAALGFLGLKNIYRMNAIKNINAVAINVVASLIFIFNGRVNWKVAAMMAVAAIIGGYGGAGIALKIGQKRVRQIVIGIGLAIAAIMFYRQFKGMI